ncbi:hypothetical protein HPP92_017576 [Vanilla planifolia]|uniref:TLC domain-containing protein n=1 Tax=Vanilla planifolia TaxID=51239 RepID=A0A835UNQ6_VANPL|nr:hypothetical protein HPP92_017576 [Vanilla planifolia]
MAPIWDGGGAPDASQLLIAILFAMGFGLARLILNSLIYKRLAIRLLHNGCSPLMVDDSKLSKVDKCSESMWKFTYYASVQMWVISILCQAPWAMNTKQYFEGWPNQELGFFRIGTVILALHDTCDVFLEAAKVFKYSEKESRASLCFGGFAISWLLLRLIFFPFWIIKASSYYSINALVKSGQFPRTLYYIFNTMLLMLLVFHIYWGKLIFAMITRQLKNQGKVGEDIRSDSEDED